MSIFGQVWLWSLAAFFVGVLLTWLVLVLPLRRSVRKLESSLAQAHADAARTPANAAGLAAPGTEVFARRPEPRPEPEPSRQETSYPGTAVLNRDDVHDDIDADFAELDSQVPLRTPPEPEPEDTYRPPAQDDTYRPPAPDDAFRPEPEPEGDDPYRSAATHYLNPVDEPEPADPYRAAATEYLVPGEDPEAAPGMSRLEQKLDPDSAGSLFQPPPEPAPTSAPDWFEQETSAERSAFEEPVERTRYLSSVGGETPAAAEPETPQYAFGGDEDAATGGELDVPPETPAEATQVLPKRQPREALRGGFVSPQPIQPSMRTVERREADLSGAQSGSLFEPSVQPSQPAHAAPEPPPARQVAEDAVPPGPFGPGSAMPRPGGGRPSEGFEVKASVTALRYCTEDSAQFPKMVAEVWFRTAEDAERVGFRPLS
jgi:hypothetical protein